MRSASKDNLNNSNEIGMSQLYRKGTNNRESSSNNNNNSSSSKIGSNFQNGSDLKKPNGWGTRDSYDDLAFEVSRSSALRDTNTSSREPQPLQFHVSNLTNFQTFSPLEGEDSNSSSCTNTASNITNNNNHNYLLKNNNTTADENNEEHFEWNRKHLRDSTNDMNLSHRLELKSRYRPQFNRSSSSNMNRENENANQYQQVHLQQQQANATHHNNNSFNIQLETRQPLNSQRVSSSITATATIAPNMSSDVQSSNAYLKAMKALQSKLAILESEREEQKAEIAEKDKSIQQLQGKLVESSQSLAEVTKKLNSDEEAYAAKEQTLMERIRGIESANESLNTRNKSDATRFKNRIEKLEKERNELEAAKKRASEDIDSLNKSLLQANALAAEQALQIRSLVSDNTLMNSDIEVFRSKCLELQKHCNEKQQINEEQAKRIEQLETRNAQILNDLHAVTEENKQVTSLSHAAQNLNSKLLSAGFLGRKTSSPELGSKIQQQQQQQQQHAVVSEATFSMPPRAFTSLSSAERPSSHASMLHHHHNLSASNGFLNKHASNIKSKSQQQQYHYSQRDEMLQPVPDRMTASVSSNENLSLSQLSLNTDHVGERYQYGQSQNKSAAQRNAILVEVCDGDNSSRIDTHTDNQAHEGHQTQLQKYLEQQQEQQQQSQQHQSHIDYIDEIGITKKHLRYSHSHERKSKARTQQQNQLQQISMSQQQQYEQQTPNLTFTVRKQPQQQQQATKVTPYESLDESFSVADVLRRNHRCHSSSSYHNNRSKSSLSYAKMSINTYADEFEITPQQQYRTDVRGRGAAAAAATATGFNQAEERSASMQLRNRHEYQTVIQAVLEIEKKLVELRHVYDSLAKDVYNFKGEDIYLTVLNKKMIDLAEKIRQKQKVLASLKNQESNLANSALTTLS